MKNQNFLCKMRHDSSGVGRMECSWCRERKYFLYNKKKKKKEEMLKMTFPLQNKCYDTFSYQL